MRRAFSRPEFIPFLLTILAFGAGSLVSPYFLDLRYLLDSSSLYVEGGILALGMTFVIATGQIDLSVASNMALVACLTAKLIALGVPIGLVAPVAILAGAALGAINGALVAYGRLPSFLVTLGTLALYRGAAQAWMGSTSVPLPANFTGIDRQYVPFIWIPLPLVIFLALSVIASLVLRKAIFGRWALATGVNSVAAKFSGVPIQRVWMFVFMLTGALAGLAAILINSRLGVARFDHARGLELDIITVTVLGGTSIYGGRATIVGTVLALFLVALVRTGMGLANFSSESQLTVIGGLLIFSVGLTLIGGAIARRRESAKAGLTAKAIE